MPPPPVEGTPPGIGPGVGTSGAGWVGTICVAVRVGDGVNVGAGLGPGPKVGVTGVLATVGVDSGTLVFVRVG